MNEQELILAMSKAVSAKMIKQASEDTEAGVYPIDEMIHIVGTVTKGEDYEQEVHMKVDTWAILAVALDKLNGVTVESIIEKALTADKDEIKALKERTDKAIKSLKAPTKSVCNGKVTGKVSYEIVGDKLESGKEAVEVEAATETA